MSALKQSMAGANLTTLAPDTRYCCLKRFVR